MSYPPPTPGKGGQPMDNYPPSDYPSPSAPVTQQPESGMGYPPAGCIPPPAIPVGCPPGLEYITMIEQLSVHLVLPRLEPFEEILRFEKNEEYSIKDSMGQQIYAVKEDTDCCTRNCLGRCRPFLFHVNANNGVEVINFTRTCRCDGCCCPCCLQRLEVGTASGNLIGAVVQEWTFCAPQYRIENASGETVLRIEGPICKTPCCGEADIEFQVLTPNNLKIGNITKKWAKFIKEVFTDEDHFRIDFPVDLEVNIKSLLIGASFLIDHMFFPRVKREDDCWGNM